MKKTNNSKPKEAALKLEDRLRYMENRLRSIHSLVLSTSGVLWKVHGWKAFEGNLTLEEWEDWEAEADRPHNSKKPRPRPIK
jgi:hypothetical protein